MQGFEVSRIPDQGGAVTFWRLAAQLRLDAIKDGLAELGLQDHSPSPRSSLACLRDAISAILARDKKKNMLVPLDDKSGYAVIAAEGDGGMTVGNLWGKVVYVVKIQDNLLAMEPHDARVLSEIEDLFRASQGMISAPVAGKCLVDICKLLNGTCLRPSGGIYWMHESVLDLWGHVAQVFAKASEDGKSVVYLIRHSLDMDSVRAVCDSMIQEATSQLETIRAEITSGELGEQALQHREKLAEQIATKLREYEGYLGVSFETTRNLAEQMTDAQAFAALFQAMPKDDLVAV
jgi:hypothetical protein